jgi:hypothetical protein
MIRRCVGLSAARRLKVVRPRRAQMGCFETKWLAVGKNLFALTELSGQWIDRVHARRPPRGVVLDMDSSVSPTHGEQEMSVWNGHYECTCYHPLFVFNQFGDLERCALRPGNVHSADGWENVLKPVVARYRGKVSRLYFRADAGFANPEVYEYLEAEAIKYAIRLPANRILQERISYLLTRQWDGRQTTYADHLPISPIRREAGQIRVGWSPRSSGIRANSFRVSASSSQTWPGPPRMSSPSKPRPLDRALALLNPLLARSALIVVMPLFRRQCSPPSASCARLQSRQFPSHSGDAGAHQGVVADEPEGKTDQDRREGRQPRALFCVPDGRGRNPTKPVRRHLAVDRRIAAAGRIDSVGRSSVLCFDSNSRERCVLRTENSALLAAQQGVCSFRRHQQSAATILACWKRRTGADLRSGPRPSGECRLYSPKTLEYRISTTDRGPFTSTAE